MVWLKAFIAGVLATLIFHQGLYTVFFYADLVPAPPYNLSPVPPFGVPAVLSLAFFGGLWAMVLWALLGRMKAAAFWSLMVILGAIGPTAVAMLVVFPLKGIDVSAQKWIGGILLNGFWGLGVALFLNLMAARKPDRFQL